MSTSQSSYSCDEGGSFLDPSQSSFVTLLPPLSPPAASSPWGLKIQWSSDTHPVIIRCVWHPVSSTA